MDHSHHLESIRRSLVMLVLLGLFGFVYFTKDLLLPILLGFLIALTLSPLIRTAARVGIPHAVSAIALVTVTAIGIAVTVYFSASTVSGWVSDSRQMGIELQQKLAGVTEQLEDVRQATEDMADLAGGGDDGPVREIAVQQPTLMSSAMSVAANVGATIAVALVLALFLLSSGDLFYIKLVQSFETMTGKKRALNMVYDIERRVSRYLLTITVINACLGLAVGGVMHLLGLKYAYIWGTAAFLLNFLPYLGGMIGVALSGAYAIISFDSFSYALLVPICYFGLTTFEGNILTPLLVGRRLELNTVSVFLTVVVWGWLWGIAGALVAVPFLVIFKVICENIDSLAVFGNFLGKAGMRTAPNDATDPEGEPVAD